MDRLLPESCTLSTRMQRLNIETTKTSDESNALQLFQAFVKQHLDPMSKSSRMATGAYARATEHDFKALDITSVDLPKTNMKEDTPLLHHAIRQWLDSAEGKRQAATFKLPSWDYRHMLSRLGQLPGGLQYVMGLILHDLQRRYDAIEVRAKSIGDDVKCLFASDLVNHYEWDQWTFQYMKQWCWLQAQPWRSTTVLVKDSEATTLAILNQIFDVQRGRSCITSMGILPLTTRYLYGRVRRPMVQNILHSIVDSRLPVELVTMIEQAYLTDEDYQDYRFGQWSEEPEVCHDEGCCHNHGHVYNNYIVVWDNRLRRYGTAHFDGALHCDMEDWTCVGKARANDVALWSQDGE